MENNIDENNEENNEQNNEQNNYLVNFLKYIPSNYMNKTYSCNIFLYNFAEQQLKKYEGYIIENNLYMIIFNRLVNLYTPIFEKKNNIFYPNHFFKNDDIEVNDIKEVDENNIPKNIVEKKSKVILNNGNYIIIENIIFDKLDIYHPIFFVLENYAVIPYGENLNINNKQNNRMNLEKLRKSINSNKDLTKIYKCNIYKIYNYQQKKIDVYTGYIIKNNLFIMMFDKLINLYTPIFKKDSKGEYFINNDFNKNIVNDIKVIDIKDIKDIGKNIVEKNCTINYDNNNYIIKDIILQYVEKKLYYNILLKLNNNNVIPYKNNYKVNTKNIQKNILHNFNIIKNSIYNSLEVEISGASSITYKDINELMSSIKTDEDYEKYKDSFYKVKIDVNPIIYGYITNNNLYVQKKNMIISIVSQIFIQKINNTTTTSSISYILNQTYKNITEKIKSIEKIDLAKSENSIKKFNSIILKGGNKILYSDKPYYIKDFKYVIRENKLVIKAGIIDKEESKILYVNCDSDKISFIHSTLAKINLHVGNSVFIENNTNTDEIVKIENINGIKYAFLSKNINKNIPLNSLKKADGTLLKVKKNKRPSEIISTEKGYFTTTKKYTPGMRVALRSEPNKLYYIKSINEDNSIKLKSKTKINDMSFSDVYGKFTIADLTSAENIDKGDIVVLNSTDYRNPKKYLTVMDKNDDLYILSNKQTVPKVKIFKVMTNPSKEVFVDITKNIKNKKSIVKRSTFGSITGLKKHARVTFQNNATHLYYIDKPIDKTYVQLYSKNDENSKVIPIKKVYNLSSISSADIIKKGDIVIIREGSLKDTYKNRKKYLKVTNISGNVYTLENGSKYTEDQIFKVLSRPTSTYINPFKGIFSGTNKKNTNSNKNLVMYKGNQYKVIKKPGTFDSTYTLQKDDKTIRVSKKNFDNLIKPTVISRTGRSYGRNL